MKRLSSALNDVYRDLRDRHLLLPALGLLVAVIAVPMLLGGSDPAPLPTAAPVVQSDSDSAVSSAVLADEQVNVRNYRKRLDQLKSKNPFKQQFRSPIGGPPAETATTGDTTTATTTTGDSTATTTGGSSSSTGGGYPTETGTPDDPSLTDTTDTGGTDTGGGSSDGGNGNGGNGNGGNNQPSSNDVEVVNHLFTRRVDLMIGLQGDPKLHENVKPMTILPDATTPVVAFLGTDEEGKRAAFVVSKLATMVAGDGACVPTPENCLYITLQKGETATLDFGPDGQTFDLRLLEIRDHEIKAE